MARPKIDLSRYFEFAKRIQLNMDDFTFALPAEAFSQQDGRPISEEDAKSDSGNDSKCFKSSGVSTLSKKRKLSKSSYSEPTKTDLGVENRDYSEEEKKKEYFD